MRAPSKAESHSDLKLFECLAEALPLGVLIWKAKSKKSFQSCLNVFVNEQVVEILKTPKKKILNQTAGEAFPFLKKTELPLVYKTLIEAKISQRMTFPYGDNPLEQKQLQVDLLLLGSNHIALLLTDVSPQVKIQKELEEKMNQLERLNKFMVGREVRMMELKRENDRLGRNRGASSQ